MRRKIIDLKPDGTPATSGPPVCRRCHKAPPEEGVGTCDSCRQYERVKAAIWRADAREICRCLVCKEPLEASTHKYRGKTVPSRYCAKHSAYYRDRYKAARRLAVRPGWSPGRSSTPLHLWGRKEKT